MLCRHNTLTNTVWTKSWYQMFILCSRTVRDKTQTISRCKYGSYAPYHVQSTIWTISRCKYDDPASTAATLQYSWRDANRTWIKHEEQIQIQFVTRHEQYQDSNQASYAAIQCSCKDTNTAQIEHEEQNRIQFVTEHEHNTNKITWATPP